MNYKPMGERLFLEPEDQQRTYGSLIIPEGVGMRHKRAKVLAVGHGIRKKDGTRAKPTVKVGEVVQYANHAGYVVKLDDKTAVLVVNESDVLALVEEELPYAGYKCPIGSCMTPLKVKSDGVKGKVILNVLKCKTQVIPDKESKV